MLTKIAKNCRAVAITCKSSIMTTVEITLKLKSMNICINITTISTIKLRQKTKQSNAVK